MTASSCRAARDAVTGGVMVKKDQVAGLLTTEIVSLAPHGFDHVAVADLGADQFAAHILHGLFKTHIAHDRGDQGFFPEFAAGKELLGADGHDVVTVDDPALFIADDEPVAVPVQGKADIGPHAA